MNITRKDASLVTSKTAYGPDFFGQPPLLPSEDREKYKLLFRDVRATIDPKDMFENVWVLELTHQIWETFRFRRMSVELLIGGKQMALERVLRHLIHGTDNERPAPELPGRDEVIRGDAPVCKSERLAKEYMRGGQRTIDEVNEALLKAGFTWDMVEAEAAAMRSPELQRITQLLAKAESRRNATLKAIERHRTGLGEQLRLAAEAFEASELEKLRAAGTAQKLAA
jgi:hypothetical protein